MNFFNRAIKNVTRKLSKTILLIITFFVIGNFVIIGLSVSNAADSAKTLTRQKMRAVVSYGVDYNAVWEYVDSLEDEDAQNEFYKNFPYITLDDVNALIKDERVKTANAIENTQAYVSEGSGIDYVHLNNQYEQDIESRGGESCYYMNSDTPVCEKTYEPAFYIKANYFPSMIEFEDGDYKIVDGRFYTAEEINNASKVMLISEALAKQNNLKVGDSFTFQTDGLYKYLENAGLTVEDLTYTFEIIGIYSHNSPLTPDSPNYDWASPYENFDNLLLMPGTAYNAISVLMQQKMFDYYASIYPEDEYYSNPENRPTAMELTKITLYDVVLLLNDPLEVDDFVKEYKGNVGQFKKISVDNEEFEKLSKPLDTLSDYATFIIWLVVVNAIVIISLVTALTLKTREYEIGVLLSIGATKFKIIAQFFIELALVAIIGFTLAVGSGSIISKSVGTKLLENQIETAGLNEEEDDYYYEDYISIWDNDYTTEVTLEDIIAEYDVTISPVIIGEIYILGLGIVLISVLIPSIMIMRFNPKKILMNQY